MVDFNLVLIIVGLIFYPLIAYVWLMLPTRYEFFYMTAGFDVENDLIFKNDRQAAQELLQAAYNKWFWYSVFWPWAILVLVFEICKYSVMSNWKRLREYYFNKMRKK